MDQQSPKGADADADELSIRAASPEDHPAIIELCRASLGWKPQDPNEAFFTWKHLQNPVGASPMWVAVAPDGTLTGVRVFLRWRFSTPGGEMIHAVRAVDTATHPDWQGRGIFTRLTSGALPKLADEGVGAVFNTPNDQSRPGYLKMGWQEVGRVPVSVRLRSIASTARMAGARAAAEKWSIPLGLALDACEALADVETNQRILDRAARPTGMATARTPDYLAWRYSFAPLAYRVMPLGDRMEDGTIVFRVRRRGTATEMAVCEVLAPSGAKVGRAMSYLLRRSGADYAIVTAGAGGLAGGFVQLPRLGPVLTWRPVARSGVPAVSDLDLSLGDVELF